TPRFGISISVVVITGASFAFPSPVQLKPPCDIQLANTSQPSYNLTWKLCVLSHYLHRWLEYEVWYRKKSASEDPVILPIVQDQKWLKIEALPPDADFEAAVRVKTQTRSNYNSIWSHWSKPMTWRTYSKGRTYRGRPAL
ncbi:hypothetical protein lerEdw1_019576, partial [Lerista edwardsae]